MKRYIVTPKRAAEALKFLRRDSAEHDGHGASFGTMASLRDIERGVEAVPASLSRHTRWNETHSFGLAIGIIEVINKITGKVTDVAQTPTDKIRRAVKEVEQGAATADHASVEDGPAFARGARWASSTIINRLEINLE